MIALEGNAITIKKAFSRETSIHVSIQADKKVIWNLLINTGNYPNWNSTIVSIEGKIAFGEKIKFKSYLDPTRVFKLTVKEVIPEVQLVWGDFMGTRKFSLVQHSIGITSFTMTEKIASPFFPMFSEMIPSFDASFERFADD